MGRVGVDIYPAADRRRARGRRRPSASSSAAAPPTSPSPRPGTAAASAVDHPHRRRPVRPLRPPGAARLRRRRPLRDRRRRTCRRRSRSARSSRRTTSRSTSTAARPRPTCRSAADELDLDAIAAAGIFWVDRHRPVARSRAASAHLAALAGPGPAARITVLDLDYRPMFWPSREEARAQVQPGAAARRRSPSATSRSARSRSARRDPRARGRGAARRAASTSRSSSRARRACWPRPRDETRRGAAASRSRSSTASAPGDAFGGALCHGLLAGWALERDARASPTPPARSSPPGWPARRRCRRPPRSRRCWRARHDRAERESTRPADVATSRVRAARRRSPRLRPPRAPDRRPARADRPAACSSPPTTRPAGRSACGDDPMAMADRGDLLGRLATALARPGVDGVLGTADILEDLLLMGALEDKVVIGSMNRGGLAGHGLRARRPLHRATTPSDDRRAGLRRRQDADCASTPTTRRRRRTLEACAQRRHASSPTAG